MIYYIAASIVGYYFSQWLFVHKIAEEMYLEKGGLNPDMSDDEAADFGNRDISQEYEGGKKNNKKFDFTESEAYESGSNNKHRNSIPSQGNAEHESQNDHKSEGSDLGQFSQGIGSSFNRITINSLVFLLDPPLRLITLTLSPISSCLCRRHGKILAKAERRFIEELDVRNLLTKVRNTDTIVKGLVRKDYLKVLKFNKQSIIAPNHPTDSSDAEQLSSEGE